MTQISNLDSVTRRCPCGASISGQGERIAEWTERHLAHCDGTLRITHASDCLEVLAKIPDDKVVKI
jgi:hypothetical protein